MARQGGKDRGVTFKDGSWWVRFYNSGKEIWRKCDSKGQARSLYGKLKAQVREDTYFPKAKKREPLLFKNIAKDYETTVDAERRRQGDDRARVQHWMHRFGNQDVESITTSQIEKELTNLRAPLRERSGRLNKGHKRSLETIRRYYGVLHAILEKARKRLKEQKVYMMNPASDIELKKADNSLVRYLTPSQEHDLLTALPSRYHPIVLTAINTGMRRGELLRLKWSDLDWFAGAIRIRETKTGEPRHAPMNSTVQQALSNLKDTAKPLPSDYIFPFYPRYLGRVFQRAVIQAKLAPFRFHDLRHCFASRLASLGANDRTIMEAGGWSSPAMLKRYVHLGPSTVWQAVERLAEVGTGSKTGSEPTGKMKEAAGGRAGL
jgi:integrase